MCKQNWGTPLPPWGVCLKFFFRHMHQKFFAAINGGLSQVLHVRRHDSEDPHLHQQKFTNWFPLCVVFGWDINIPELKPFRGTLLTFPLYMGLFS